MVTIMYISIEMKRHMKTAAKGHPTKMTVILASKSVSLILISGSLVKGWKDEDWCAPSTVTLGVFLFVGVVERILDRHNRCMWKKI